MCEWHDALIQQKSFAESGDLLIANTCTLLTCRQTRTCKRRCGFPSRTALSIKVTSATHLVGPHHTWHHPISTSLGIALPGHYWLGRTNSEILAWERFVLTMEKPIVELWVFLMPHGVTWMPCSQCCPHNVQLFYLQCLRHRYFGAIEMWRKRKKQIPPSTSLMTKLLMQRRFEPSKTFWPLNKGSKAKKPWNPQPRPSASTDRNVLLVMQ